MVRRMKKTRREYNDLLLEEWYEQYGLEVINMDKARSFKTSYLALILLYTLTFTIIILVIIGIIIIQLRCEATILEELDISYQASKYICGVVFG